METPENIWLSPNEYRSNEPSCFWSESQRTDYDIAYIRKDAFIEKACKWLRKELVNFEDYSGMGEELISDFRKAMSNETE